MLNRCSSQNMLLGFNGDAAKGLKQRRLISKNLKALAEMHRKNEEKCANIVENEFDSLPNNLTNSIIIEDAEEHRETGHGRHRSNNTVLIRRTLQSLSSEDPEKQDGNRTCRGMHSRNEVLMK